MDFRCAHDLVIEVICLFNESRGCEEKHRVIRRREFLLNYSNDVFRYCNLRKFQTVSSDTYKKLIQILYFEVITWGLTQVRALKYNVWSPMWQDFVL